MQPGQKRYKAVSKASMTRQSSSEAAQSGTNFLKREFLSHFFQNQAFGMSKRHEKPKLKSVVRSAAGNSRWRRSAAPPEPIRGRDLEKRCSRKSQNRALRLQEQGSGVAANPKIEHCGYRNRAAAAPGTEKTPELLRSRPKWDKFSQTEIFVPLFPKPGVWNEQET